MTRLLSAAARLCAAFALLLCAYAYGQTTTITATQQQWGGTWLTQGTISLIPVTPDGNPQAFSANGKFYPPASRNNFTSGFTGTIVKGALTTSLSVPDKTSATASYPLCYDVQLRNDNTGQVADIGVRCDITGATVSLDIYVPPAVTPLYVAGYTHGVLAAIPGHCAAGAQYGADDTYAIYFCGLDGTFHTIAGGSGSGIAPTISIGTVTQGSAAASITGSNGAYTLNLTIPQGAPGANGAAVPSVSAQTSSGTVALAFSNTADVVYDVTLSAATTFSFTAPSTTGTYRKLTLIIRPAGYQATLPASSSSLVWAGGSPPAVSTSNPTIITFTSTGNAPIFGGL